MEADLDTCEARDPKGLYKKARAGEIRGFTGIDAPYFPPHPGENTLIVNTSVMTADECAELIIEKLNKIGVFK